MPNQGSTLSDVLPMKGNQGSHAIHAYPAAGSLSGGGSAVPAVGYANQGGVGLSNIINAVPTHGYLAANYPTAYLRIVGAARHLCSHTARSCTGRRAPRGSGTRICSKMVRIHSNPSNQGRGCSLFGCAMFTVNAHYHPSVQGSIFRLTPSV